MKFKTTKVKTAVFMIAILACSTLTPLGVAAAETNDKAIQQNEKIIQYSGYQDATDLYDVIRVPIGGGLSSTNEKSTSTVKIANNNKKYDVNIKGMGQCISLEGTYDKKSIDELGKNLLVKIENGNNTIYSGKLGDLVQRNAGAYEGPEYWGYKFDKSVDVLKGKTSEFKITLELDKDASKELKELNRKIYFLFYCTGKK